MKAKRKLRAKTRRHRRGKIGGVVSFQTAVSKARKQIRNKKFHKLQNAIQTALNSIKKKKISYPKQRIVPIPKTGGFLPLIPIFAALSALGALGTGGSAIYKAIKQVKNSQNQLDEAKRHNKTMEAIALGKGLHVKAHKKGLGLYLAPYKKNSL